jgi:ribosomal protein S18 acetylase RimI-like enzyme
MHHKGNIWGVYVTPAKRRQAVGKRMLQMLLERAAHLDGVEQILLSVSANQVAAIGLYRALGFESWGTEPRALKVGSSFIDEEYMLLQLKK